MANVVNLLESRRLGIDPLWLLPTVYGSQKWTEIGLSKDKTFEKFHHKGVTALDLENSTDQYLISGGSTGSIGIYDVNSKVDHICPLIANVTGSSTSSAHTHGISTVQWYPHDNGIFTSSSADKTLRIWDANEMCLFLQEMCLVNVLLSRDVGYGPGRKGVVERFKFAGPVYSHCMSYSEKHSLIAVGCTANNVTLCDIQSGSNTHILRGHRLAVLSVKWSPSNEYLLASGSQDNKVLFWDIRKAAGPLQSLDQHNGGGASNSSSVITAHNGYVTGMTFTDDGLFLVTMGTDQRARLWDVFTGINMLVNYGRIVHDGHHNSHHITLSPSSITHKPHLLVPTKSDLSMYELFTGKLITKLRGHYGKVADCVTNNTTIEIYSAGNDCNLLLWKPEAKLPKQRLSSQVRIYHDTWSSDEDY